MVQDWLYYVFWCYIYYAGLTQFAQLSLTTKTIKDGMLFLNSNKFILFVNRKKKKGIRTVIERTTKIGL